MSAWQDLVTASLIGTERSGVPPAAAPVAPIRPDAPPDIPFPDNPLPSSPADPAALLLDRAALLTAARRGGRRPERADPLPAAEPDPAGPVRPAAGRRLARLLGGEHPDLLAEWLTAAVARGRRVPAHLLPALLDQARRGSPADPGLRRLAAEAGGARARWLAGLNPDWKFVTAHNLASQDTWRLGNAAQRRGYLTALRARDPGAARELIADGWAAAAPGERFMFVSAMADGLSLADEPLLEAALGDDNAFVRKMAADVLAALPGSALGQRMAGRALGCVRLHQGGHGTRLVVTPPAQCNAAMRRDGITPGQSEWYSGPAGQSHLLLEVLARTPLRTWTGEFGRPAGQILALPSGGWAPALFAGWARAAMTQRDQEWMAILVNRALADGPPGTPFGAEALRQLARRVDPALVTPATAVGRGAEPHPAVLDAIGVLRFRYDMLKELDDDDSAG
jgi:hypothetical protein